MWCVPWSCNDVLKKDVTYFLIFFKGNFEIQRALHMFAVTNFCFILSSFCALSTRAGFCFLGRVCRDQRSTARRKGRTTLFFPHCVQSAERDVEYQNNPKVEEVLSHQHPSVAWSSASGLSIFDMIILVQVHHFDRSLLDFYRHW